MVKYLTSEDRFFLTGLLFGYLTDLQKKIDSLAYSDSTYDSMLDSIKEEYNFVDRLISKIGGYYVDK